MNKKIKEIAIRDAETFMEHASLEEIDNEIEDGHPSKYLIEGSGREQCMVYFGVDVKDLKKALKIYDAEYIATLEEA